MQNRVEAGAQTATDLFLKSHADASISTGDVMEVDKDEKDPLIFLDQQTDVPAPQSPALARPTMG
jgi:hypothetical protein